MKFINDVYSSVEPKLIDLESSPTTIYIRENVRITEDGEMFVYDEYQYDITEYLIMKTKEFDNLKELTFSLLNIMSETQLIPSSKIDKLKKLI